MILVDDRSITDISVAIVTMRGAPTTTPARKASPAATSGQGVRIRTDR
jgi:hypothetical protein